MRTVLPVPSRTLRLLAAGIACLGAGGTALANATAGTALLGLLQAGEVSCQPTLPYFCENMHVRCSGRTPVPTFEFMLRGTGRPGSLELVTAPEEFQRRYKNAKVEWGTDGDGYVLLQPNGASGYIKLQWDGRYVFRHYVQGLGVMSLGHCK